MAKIIGSGAPTKNTPGQLGQEYFDKNSKTVYTCTNVKPITSLKSGETDAEYEWTAAASGGSGSANLDEILKAANTDTLTWDGNTEGLECVINYDDEYETQGLYKVSDVVLSIDDLTNGGKLYTTSGLYPFTAQTDGLILEIPNYAAFEGCYIVFNDFTNNDGKRLTKGIWFQRTVYHNSGNTEIVHFLTINGYTGFPGEKKIKEELLPELCNPYILKFEWVDGTVCLTQGNFDESLNALLNPSKQVKALYLTGEEYLESLSIATNRNRNQLTFSFIEGISVNSMSIYSATLYADGRVETTSRSYTLTPKE